MTEPHSLPEHEPARADRSAPRHPLTWIAAGLCVAMTVAWDIAAHLHLQTAAGLTPFGPVPLPDVWSGRYDALLTSVFLHGTPDSLIATLVHIGFNLLWLIALGRLLEESIHPLLWLAFFIAASIVTNGVEIAVSSANAIGASGVVYAMFGLMYAGRSVHPEWGIVANGRNLRLLIGWGLFCIAVTITHVVEIANAAHFGGLLFGLALGWLTIAHRRQALSIVTLAFLVVLSVLSVTWMPWSLPWTMWDANHQVTAGHPRRAIAAYRRSIALGADPVRAWLLIAGVEERRHNAPGAERALAEAQRWAARRVAPSPANGGR